MASGGGAIAYTGPWWSIDEFCAGIHRTFLAKQGYPFLGNKSRFLYKVKYKVKYVVDILHSL